MKPKPKYRKLRSTEIIRVGDFVTIAAQFSPQRLKVDRHRDMPCAVGAWVELSNSDGPWIGKRMSEYAGAGARRIKPKLKNSKQK